MSTDEERCNDDMPLDTENFDGCMPVDIEKCNDSVMTFLIDSGTSFNFVESSGAIALINYLNPHYSLPSKDSIVQKFVSSYKREIAKLKKCFQSLHGCVSITMGWWSDVRTVDYVCLTAHYIDNDWKLQKKIISFRQTLWDEAEFRETLLSCLTKWKIKKLFSLILENSLAKVVTPLQLTRKLNTYAEPSFDVHNMPCHADIFALLAREGLDSISSTLLVIRDAVRYTQRSEIESIFYKIAKELKVDTKQWLYVDLPTLWHSTYFMLENTLRYQEVFVRLETSDPDFSPKPTQDDWIKASSLCRILKPFYNAAKLFSDKKTTADMHFTETWKLYMHLKTESMHSDPFVCPLATRMKKMFDEYWNSCFVTLAVGTILNPRHKMLMVEFCFQKLHGSDSADHYVKLVRNGIQKFYDEYDSLPMNYMDTSDGASTSLNGDCDQSDSYIRDYREFLEKHYQKQSLKSELETYLEEKVEDGKFDILTYWKLNQPRFPKLARMARDMLAIPLVSRASDSVFYIGDRVLEERYSNMGAGTLEARICMQNWLPESYPGHATILDGEWYFDEKDYEVDEEEEAEECEDNEGEDEEDETENEVEGG